MYWLPGRRGGGLIERMSSTQDQIVCYEKTYPRRPVRGLRVRSRAYIEREALSLPTFEMRARKFGLRLQRCECGIGFGVAQQRLPHRAGNLGAALP